MSVQPVHIVSVHIESTLAPTLCIPLEAHCIFYSPVCRWYKDLPTTGLLVRSAVLQIVQAAVVAHCTSALARQCTSTVHLRSTTAARGAGLSLPRCLAAAAALELLAGRGCCCKSWEDSARGAVVDRSGGRGDLHRVQGIIPDLLIKHGFGGQM